MPKFDKFTVKSPITNAMDKIFVYDCIFSSMSVLNGNKQGNIFNNDQI